MFKFTPSGLGCCCGSQQPGPICITTAPVETARTLCQSCGSSSMCLSLATGGGPNPTSNPCHALDGAQITVPNIICNHYSNGSAPVSWWQSPVTTVAALPDFPPGPAVVQVFVDIQRGCTCSDASGVPTAVYSWSMLAWYRVFLNEPPPIGTQEWCREPIWANNTFSFIHRELQAHMSGPVPTAQLMPTISSATWEFNIIANGTDIGCRKCVTPDFGQFSTGWTLTQGACAGAGLPSFQTRVRMPRIGEPTKLWLPPTLSGGPGTELKKILRELQVEDESCVTCDERARTMDQQGPGWCRDNRLMIAGWLHDEAKARITEFEYTDKSEDWLEIVDEAIRRAEEKAMA